MADATQRPSVLVGVLHVGEPSLPRALDRIRAQQDVAVELLEIGHETKAEAHRRLFDAFSDAADRHDALVKVDADMELVPPNLLHAIGTLFRQHPDLDHLLLGVDDWYSGRRIQGMNAWRNGVRWTAPPPDLFTDLATNTARTKLKVMDCGRPLVLHATDPSDEQAIRYGLQRGLKAAATGKASRVERLLDVVDHAGTVPERGRRLAVAALEAALSDPVSARDVLDRARDGVTDVAPFAARLDDPGLCDDVRARITTLAAHTAPTAPAEPHDPPSALSRLRGRAARFARSGPRGVLSRAAAQAMWRESFLALLADDQPSRSSA
jgi:hypothetical protein